MCGETSLSQRSRIPPSRIDDPRHLHSRLEQAHEPANLGDSPECCATACWETSPFIRPLDAERNRILLLFSSQLLPRMSIPGRPAIRAGEPRFSTVCGRVVARRADSPWGTCSGSPHATSRSRVFRAIDNTLNGRAFCGSATRARELTPRLPESNAVRNRSTRCNESVSRRSHRSVSTNAARRR